MTEFWTPQKYPVVSLDSIGVEYRFASTMSTIHTLPPELLLSILTGLDRASQKSARSAARIFYTAATDALFGTLFFDFDENGVASLVAVSKHQELASRVRTVTLHRRSNLPYFKTFQL